MSFSYEDHPTAKAVDRHEIQFPAEVNNLDQAARVLASRFGWSGWDSAAATPEYANEPGVFTVYYKAFVYTPNDGGFTRVCVPSSRVLGYVRERKEVAGDSARD